MENNLLIISNACLSQTDSNGRSILRLIEDVPFKNRAQFFTYGNPDFNECKQYYQVSDKDALKSIFNRSKSYLKNAKEIIHSANTSKKVKKTPFKMLLREYVWKISGWNNKHFKKWVCQIKPNCILLVGGDNCYLIDIAIKLAKRNKLPIILYSTEEYQFKNYNYLTKRKSLFYWIFRKKIQRKFLKLSRYVKVGIFNSDALRDLYKKNYCFECKTIYQTSNIQWENNLEIKYPLKVSYLGNLGLNRHIPLIEMAHLLDKLFPGTFLSIYGKCTKEVEKELSKISNIKYMGIVPYQEVIKVIRDSTIVAHVEYCSEFYKRDLAYAFSTKIGDSVSSGTPLLIYAPACLEETIFLKENNCAFVATNIDELGIELNNALTDLDCRKTVLKNAKSVKEKFFTKNSSFKSILEKIINESCAN